MLVIITVIQVVQSLLNIWWKFLLSSKNPRRSSWLYTAIDTGLFVVIGLYFKLYQLVAFELFFMFVAVGLFSKKLHRLHYITIGLIVGIVYLVNTINPVTTLELLAVVFFIVAIYFWANNKMRLGWIFIIPGHIFLSYVLISKGGIIIAIAQMISLALAIRGIINSKSLENGKEK